MPPRGPDDRRAALLRGQHAEDRVARHLRAQGWTVLARNWRARGGELDVVVQRDGVVRIVEVKQRAADDPVGLEAISRSKQDKLRRAALAWLEQYTDYYEEVAFTVAYIEGDAITWIDDAF